MQITNQIKVRVVAYKDRIVIVPNEPEKGISKKNPLWWPTGGPKGWTMGCVVGPTETMLGVSQEALALMENIERNRDAVGDISWWECDDGSHAFAWWGAIYRIIDPNSAEADRDFHLKPSVVRSCTIIPNDVPEEAQKVIDAFNTDEEEPAHWKEPLSLEYEDNEPDED